MKQLIELKKQMKKKRPKFVRSVAHKIKRISSKVWRKPKGLQNKMRLSKSGHRKSVSIGFRSPASVRGLTKEGIKPIIVYDIKSLENIDKEKQGVILGKTGMKKRALLIKKAESLGIRIFNIGNVGESLKNIDDKIKRRKEKKTQREKRKTEKAKEKKKKEKEKPKLDEKIEKEATKKEKEKRELDKLLTKKEK